MSGQAGGRSGSDGLGGDGATRPKAVLIGPPGAGKSTIGRRLAQALGTEVYDTDVAIERESGRTIPQIFVEDGEAAFRELEERIVIEALRTYPGVVSLGGGAVLSARTREALRGHTVVYLEISVGEGLRRTGVTSATATRPLLAGGDPRAKYRELMRTRRPLYREVATIRVRTDGRSPARVVGTVLGRLGVPVADRVSPTRTPAASKSPARMSPRRRVRRKGGRPIPTDPRPPSGTSGSDDPPAQESVS